MSRFVGGQGEGVVPSPADNEYAAEEYDGGLDGGLEADDEHHHGSALATLYATFAAGLSTIMARPVTRHDFVKADEGAGGGADAAGADNAKARKGPAGSSSCFRGVTRHRRTRRWEAHIWDSKKQVYLGGFDEEGHAAKAHDVMALKTRGVRTLLNFKPAVYEELLPLYDRMGKDEVVRLLRGQSKKVLRTNVQPSPRPRAPPAIARVRVKPTRKPAPHTSATPQMSRQKSPLSRTPAFEASAEPSTPPRQQWQQQQEQQEQEQQQQQGSCPAAASPVSAAPVIGSPGAHLHALLMRKHHRLELQHMLLYSGLQLPPTPHSPLLPTPNSGKPGDGLCLIPNLHPGAPSSVNPLAAFDMLLPPSAHPRRPYQYPPESPPRVTPTVTRVTEPRARVTQSGASRVSPGVTAGLHREAPLPSSVLVAGRGGVRGGAAHAAMPASGALAAAAVAAAAGAAGIAAASAATTPAVLAAPGAAATARPAERDRVMQCGEADAAVVAGAAGVMALRRDGMAHPELLHETPDIIRRPTAHGPSHGAPHGPSHWVHVRSGLVPVEGPLTRAQPREQQRDHAPYLSHVQQLRRQQQQQQQHQARLQPGHMPFGVTPHTSPLSSPPRLRSLLHAYTDGLGQEVGGDSPCLYDAAPHNGYAAASDANGCSDAEMDGDDDGAGDDGAGDGGTDDDGFGAHDVPLYLQSGGFSAPHQQQQQQQQVQTNRRKRQYGPQHAYQQQGQQGRQGGLSLQLGQQQARLRQRVAALVPDADQLFGGANGGSPTASTTHRGRALLRAAVLAAAAEEAAEAAEEAAAAAAAACQMRLGKQRRLQEEEEAHEQEEEAYDEGGHQGWQGGMVRGGLMMNDDGAFDDKDEEGPEAALMPLQQHHIMGFETPAGSDGAGGCCV